MDWCRLWHDMPNDPKFRTVAARSGRTLAEVLAVFVHMLTTASQADDRGILDGWCDEDVAAALDMPEDAVRGIREAMHGKVLDGDRLTGWEKRQPKREDDSAERVRAFRERKKRAETDGNGGGTPRVTDVTQRNAPDTDTDTDTEDTPPTPPRGEEPKYAFKGETIRLKVKDLEAWRKAYHGIPDLEAELYALDDWLRDKPDKRKRWFQTVSGALNRKHQERVTAGARASPENDPLLREWLTEPAERELH